MPEAGLEPLGKHAKTRLFRSGVCHRVSPCAKGWPPGASAAPGRLPDRHGREHKGRHARMEWRKSGESMKVELTAVFEKVPEGYVAFVEELPGANTQGATIEEARRNLEEAVRLVLEANRALAEEEIAGKDVVREPLRVSAA